MSDLHPDDEALSAQLDRDDPQLHPHLDGCAACASRLAELRRVGAAVGAPVPPPPAWQRDAAIARALDAGWRRESARRAGAWAAGIAAAVLVVLGAAFGLSQLSSDRTGLQATSGAAKAGDNPATAPAPSSAVPSLGDLGALKDSAALRAAIQPSVGQSAFRTAEGAAPSDAAKQSATPTTTPTASPACAGAARALDRANVQPATTATATWQGTPAEVLIYAVEGRPGAARVYVLARRTVACWSSSRTHPDGQLSGTTRRVGSPAMPANVEARVTPATTDDTDWTVQTADTIDRVVTTIRSKTSDPLVGIARWVVFGLLAAIVATLALVLLAVASVRALVVYLPFGDDRVWAAYLIAGGIFALAGLFAFRKARPCDEG